MTMRLQRPILIGGVALSLGLWGLDSVQHSIGGMGELLTLGAIAAGGGYWWYYRQQGNKKSIATTSPQIDINVINRSIQQVELVIDRLVAENSNPARIAEFRDRLVQAQANLQRTDRRIAVTGGDRVGKSSAIALLSETPIGLTQAISYTETPTLFTAGADSQTNDAIAQEQNLAADLVLFLVNGDLTATEYKYLAGLQAAQQHVIVLFNQIDRYLPQDRDAIVQKLHSTLSSTIASSDIVTATTAPTAIKVRQVAADGTVAETIETPAPSIDLLSHRLASCLTESGEKLLWANTYRQLVGVQVAAKTTLNAHRRDRAMPIIEQNQWIVGAAAFANPLPALDLLAAAAVNVQTIVDLGAVYQQQFTLEQAQTAAAEMGSLMLKLGIVELCTQAVTSILKTNAITFVAGGLVQGLSAAYLTRIVGLTLVAYLEAQDLLVPEPARAWNLDLLGKTLQGVFQANERISSVQAIVKQGIDRLLPKDGKQLIVDS
jgi:uncharacterized protein